MAIDRFAAVRDGVVCWWCGKIWSRAWLFRIAFAGGRGGNRRFRLCFQWDGFWRTIWGRTLSSSLLLLLLLSLLLLLLLLLMSDPALFCFAYGRVFQCARQQATQREESRSTIKTTGGGGEIAGRRAEPDTAVPFVGTFIVEVQQQRADKNRSTVRRRLCTAIF